VQQGAQQTVAETGARHEVPEQIVKLVNELEGTLEAVILDESLNEVRRIPVRDLADALSELESAYAIVMDGIVTQRIVDLSYPKGIKIIVAARIGPMVKLPEDLTVLDFSAVQRAQ